jgi:hypothetical protein
MVLRGTGDPALHSYARRDRDARIAPVGPPNARTAATHPVISCRDAICGQDVIILTLFTRWRDGSIFAWIDSPFDGQMNDCFGSNSEAAKSLNRVCYTPISRHQQAPSSRPFGAKSGSYTSPGVPLNPCALSGIVAGLRSARRGAAPNTLYCSATSLTVARRAAKAR